MYLAINGMILELGGHMLFLWESIWDMWGTVGNVTLV